MPILIQYNQAIFEIREDGHFYLAGRNAVFWGTGYDLAWFIEIGRRCEQYALNL